MIDERTHHRSLTLTYNTTIASVSRVVTVIPGAQSHPSLARRGLSVGHDLDNNETEEAGHGSPQHRYHDDQLLDDVGPERGLEQHQLRDTLRHAALVDGHAGVVAQVSQTHIVDDQTAVHCHRVS